jgi:hypothetical protein
MNEHEKKATDYTDTYRKKKLCQLVEIPKVGASCCKQNQSGLIREICGKKNKALKGRHLITMGKARRKNQTA